MGNWLDYSTSEGQSGSAVPLSKEQALESLRREVPAIEGASFEGAATLRFSPKKAAEPTQGPQTGR
jgi:hypothetical protein